VGPEEAVRLVPALAPDGLLGGLHCPTDAVVDPVAAATAYAREAAALGVEVREGTPVAALCRDGDRVTGVDLATGERRAAGTVVLAAGVWSARLLAPLGLTLPARRFRREIFESERQDALRDTPFVSDLDLGWYFRSAGDRLWMSGSRERHESWGESVHWHRLEEVRARARRRLPLVARLAFPHGWAGLYALTPDGHALLGRAPGLDGLLLACGDSGHGVMHAPATGLLAAELLLDGRATTLDAAPLDPGRYDWRSPPTREDAS
jgi:sarcosine oxidase subunit beta